MIEVTEFVLLRNYSVIEVTDFVLLRQCWIFVLQCLQALEKISRNQPLACLQAGAIMVVLNLIDFFSISVQVIQSVSCSYFENWDICCFIEF